MNYKVFSVVVTFFIVTSVFSQRMTGEKEIGEMMSNLSADLESKGPIAWLDYFENTKEFFMVSDGKIAFENNKAATLFIQDTLIKLFTKIKLSLPELKIDMLTENLADIASPYNEELFKADSGKINFNGFLTAIVEKNDGKWRFRNLHWSSEKK